MWEASPMITAPIESSSRFRATPSRPPGNSRSSDAIVPGKPETRATPSPIEMTYPTVAASSDGVQPSRLRRSDSVISWGLMVSSAMSISSALVQSLAELLQAVAHGAVDDDVPDPGNDAADDGGVDDGLHLDVLAGCLAQSRGEPLDGGGVEFDGGADLGDRLPAGGCRPGGDPIGDGGENRGPPPAPHQDHHITPH